MGSHEDWILCYIRTYLYRCLHFCVAGKTALHWAAAVENIEAMVVLLQSGANVDVQDAKDETPLFLAAREGSCRAAQVLLDYGANRDIADDMDRLPRDIGQERMHFDIVKLLDEHCTTSPGMVMANNYANGATVPAFMRHSMAGKQKSRRRSRHAKAGGAPPLEGKTVKLPPETAVKRPRKKKIPRGGSTSTGTSPESLEMGVFEMPPSYESACSEVPIDPTACMNGATGGAPQGYNPGMVVAPPHHAQTAHGYMDKTPAVSWSEASCMQQAASGGGGIPYTSQPICSESPLSAASLQNSPLVHNYSPHSVAPLHTSPLAVHTYSPHAPSPGLVHAQVHTCPEGQSPSRGHTLSPTHMQAIQQHAAQQNRTHPDPRYLLDTCQYSGGDTYEPAPQCEMQQALPRHTAMIHHTMAPLHHRYPTPPSQHSQLGSDASTPPQPSGHGQTGVPDHYLTPSPDSPDQWSSESPHSDCWSDGISSPPTASHTLQWATGKNPKQRHQEVVYL